jgi:PGF-pre-PGF domain-containing protein
MGKMHKKHNIKRDRIIKKFLSCYIISLLLIGSLIVMMQVVKAEGQDSSTGAGPSISQLTADAGGSYYGALGESITFDASGSISAGGEITGYKWDWDNNGNWDTDYLISATTTHSFSAAGEYTITLKVIDQNSQVAEDTATVTISEIVDNEDEDEEDNAPTISDLSHSPTKVTNQDKVTVAAIVTDDVGINSVTLVYNDGTEKTETMTASVTRYTAKIMPFSTVGTTVTYYVEALDTTSQTTTSTTKSFIIKEAPITQEIGDIQEGQTAEVAIENSHIIGVKIKSTSALSNVKITIEKLELEDIKEATPQTGDTTVYSYIEFNLISDNLTVDEDDLEKKTIEFIVPLKWINENKIDLNTIKMMRYHDGQWIELPTIYLEGQDDETYAYFEAVTAGTSIFAILGSEVIEIKEEPEPESEMPWFIIIGVVVMIIFILFTFMFKAGFLYIEIEEMEKVDKKTEVDKKTTPKKKTNNQNNKKK